MTGNSRRRSANVLMGRRLITEMDRIPRLCWPHRGERAADPDPPH
jgi:hypothetical protein